MIAIEIRRWAKENLNFGFIINNIFSSLKAGVFLERKMFLLLNSSPPLKGRSFLEVFNKFKPN